jgi:hypothetical protein
MSSLTSWKNNRCKPALLFFQGLDRACFKKKLQISVKIWCYLHKKLNLHVSLNKKDMCNINFKYK